MRRFRCATKNRSRGVAAVELGITIVPLLILTFGVTEYGRAIYTYNALDKSVRDAARYMSAPPSADPTPAASAVNLAVYGNTAGNGSPLAPGLAAGNVAICTPASCPGTHSAQLTSAGNSLSMVTVSINGYVYNSIITYVAPATLNFSDISVTMRTNL
jgi:Flp pilus assembly protein TadG